jgi:hypothetical protein
MSKVVERDVSAYVLRGGASLAPRSAASIAPRASRRLGDWAFAAYLGFALLALVYTFVQARRFDHAVARLRSCVARADSACTSAELEAARKVRAIDVRLELGDASLSVLLHEPDRAALTQTTLEAQQKQGSSVDTDVRADLLLLRSDIAAERGSSAAARDDLQAARLLVTDPDLVTLRLKRIDSREDAARARSADELDALRQDFSDLFVAAQSGKRDITELSISKAQGWIGRVAHLEAAQQLGLAVDAARRASYAMEANNRTQPGAEPEPPQPPVRGVNDYNSGYYYGGYEAQLAAYRARLERFNKERSAAEERQRQRAADASENSSAAIEQGKAALERALLTLHGLPNPLRDAATSVAPRSPNAGLSPGISLPVFRSGTVIRAYGGGVE